MQSSIANAITSTHERTFKLARIIANFSFVQRELSRSFDEERSRFRNARASVARHEAIRTVATRALQGQRKTTDRVHAVKKKSDNKSNNDKASDDDYSDCSHAWTKGCDKLAVPSVCACEARRVREMNDLFRCHKRDLPSVFYTS